MTLWKCPIARRRVAKKLHEVALKHDTAQTLNKTWHKEPRYVT